LSNYIKPQQISKILPRPSLPPITMPTPTLQYAPQPTQTSAPPTQSPPPSTSTPTVSTGTQVSASLGSTSQLTAKAGTTTVTASLK